MLGPEVRFHLPDPALRPFITSYYFTELPPSGETVLDLLTPEWPNIRFIVQGEWSARFIDSPETLHFGSAVFGATSQAVEVTGRGPALSLGVGLLPLGWAHLIARPADEFADRALPLAEFFPEFGVELLERLQAAEDDPGRVRVLDEHFLAVHRERPIPTPLLVRAHEILLDPRVGDVEAFAAALGVSTRHAGRLSREMFGFPPKVLLQRQRFLRTLAALSQHPQTVWAELIDDGYYDQPHFVRDFKRFMGCTPTAYFTGERPLIRAAAAARRKMLGDGYQGLHPPKRA
jgi:AraC-like DNA-binding protein